MKKMFLAVMLGSLMLCTACTRDQVVTAISDARWGLAAACSQEYVTAADCQIADTGLGVAIDVAKKAAPNQIKHDAVDVLKATLVKLPPDSKAPEYFNYLILFLS